MSTVSLRWWWSLLNVTWRVQTPHSLLSTLLWKPCLTEQWQPRDDIFVCVVWWFWVTCHTPWQRKGCIKWYDMALWHVQSWYPPLQPDSTLSVHPIFSQVVVFSKTTNTRILSCLFWSHIATEEAIYCPQIGKCRWWVAKRHVISQLMRTRTSFCLFFFCLLLSNQGYLFLWRAVWSDLVNKQRAGMNEWYF